MTSVPLPGPAALLRLSLLSVLASVPATFATALSPGPVPGPVPAAVPGLDIFQGDGHHASRPTPTASSPPSMTTAFPSNYYQTYEQPLAARAATPSVASIPGASFVDCYHNDNSNVLTMYGFFDSGMTPLLCRNVCLLSSYVYFGLEQATSCLCDRTIASAAATAPAGDCNVACAGNSADLCGGNKRLDIYSVYPSRPAPAASISTPLSLPF